MAVQKSKKSRSARDMRRSHDALTASALTVEKSTGDVRMRHHVSAEGVYRGRQIVTKDSAE